MTLLATFLLAAAALVLLAAIGAWVWTLRASTRPCGRLRREFRARIAADLTHHIAGRHAARRSIRHVNTAGDSVAQALADAEQLTTPPDPWPGFLDAHPELENTR